MLSVYRNMFRIGDLRNKILFTLGIFVIYRLGAAVPVPGVDLDAVEQLADVQSQGGTFALINLLSGGALAQLSVFSLGVLPYITASIIMQLLATVIPRLQALQEEGETGRKVITQWTRYSTVALALLQSFGITFLFSRSTALTSGIILIPDYTAGRAILIVTTLTAGTALIMWLGELITQRGVGNGMSLLIFISIVAALPAQFSNAWLTSDPRFEFVILASVFLAMVVGIIYVEQGQRRIPIQFAKRVRGRRVMGGQSTYIPLKINNAGVIPIIFATSVLYFPTLLVTVIPATGESGFWGSIRGFLEDFNNAAVQSHVGGRLLWPSLIYMAVLFLLIVFFTYFYTAIQFDPVKQAETIQRQGGFVPGIRPGPPTARYLEYILTRITLPGAIFLGTISILPNVVSLIFLVSFAFGGISILIVVGVALETMKQIESQLMMRNYEGFLA